MSPYQMPIIISDWQSALRLSRCRLFAGNNTIIASDANGLNNAPRTISITEEPAMTDQNAACPAARNR
jgi:hypothetical protein